MKPLHIWCNAIIVHLIISRRVVLETQHIDMLQAHLKLESLSGQRNCFSFNIMMDAKRIEESIYVVYEEDGIMKIHQGE